MVASRTHSIHSTNTSSNMTEQCLYPMLVDGLFVCALLSFLTLMFISAPYGRHVRDGWGPTMGNRRGWILMESPAVLVFLAVFFQGQHRADLIPMALLCLWQIHYVHRTFIFPFRIRSQGKRMPVLIMTLALVFNCINAYVNARWISHWGTYSWSPQIVIGASLFVLGLAVNLHSDTVLINLRKPGETGYKIPEGGAYRWLTSPNYSGELLEWLGWAIAIQSEAGWAFFVFTAANLVPRAMTNHTWYKEKFPDYPKSRRRLIPFLF